MTCKTGLCVLDLALPRALAVCPKAGCDCAGRYSDGRLQDLDCKRIAGEELIAENEKLAALSKAQNSAATGDAVGVFLIGVPMSS